MYCSLYNKNEGTRGFCIDSRVHCDGSEAYAEIDGGRGVLISFPPLPFSSLLSHSLSIPFHFPLFSFPSPLSLRSRAPLKPARGSGSAVSSPSAVRSGARPKTNLVHSWAVSKPLASARNRSEYSEVHVCFTVDRPAEGFSGTPSLPLLCVGPWRWTSTLCNAVSRWWINRPPVGRMAGSVISQRL